MNPDWTHEDQLERMQEFADDAVARARFEAHVRQQIAEQEARERQAHRIKARRRKLGQNGFVALGRSAIPGKRPFRRTRNSR